MNLFDLSGKVALITGSSRGIGAAIARRMAEHGANVIVSSRKIEPCQETAGAINKEFGKGQEVARAVACNIAYKEQLEHLVTASRQAFGRIDILVCNAAANPYFGPMAGCPDDAFDKIMGSNVRSNFWLANLVLPEMAERKDGVVLIISSVAGLKGSAHLGVYGISKAADFQLARNIAVEYGRHNIRANAIAPGIIKTYFAKALWENEAILKAANAGTPLGRIGMPDEVAGAAVFLASPAGAYMTGQAIIIDGGRTIGE